MCFNFYTNQVEIKDELRDTVKYQVDRSTHGDKMRDFHEWMDAVKRDTLHRVSVNSYGPFHTWL